MYSSYFVSKCFVSVLVLVATEVLIRSVSSVNMTNEYLNTKCLVKQGKYRTDSVYEKLLKSNLFAFSRADFSSGYVMFNDREDDDLSSVILQCRGDTYGSKCRSCFNTAIDELRRRCPYYKGSLIWYDQCLVEISAIRTLKKINYEDNFCMYNKKNVSDDQASAFNRSWAHFISELVEVATDGKNRVNGMLKPYLAGKSRFGKETMYGMVQCTEDLSIRACKECLIDLPIYFSETVANRRGSRALGRSCSYRLEFYPFLNTHVGLKFI